MEKKKIKYDHIAVSPESKRRFEYLVRYMIRPEKSSFSQEEILIQIMDFFEDAQKKRK